MSDEKAELRQRGLMGLRLVEEGTFPKQALAMWKFPYETQCKF